MNIDIGMVIMGAATLLSGIHGNNGNHGSETVKNAVSTAIKIVQEAEAALALLQPQPPPPPPLA